MHVRNLASMKRLRMAGHAQMWLADIDHGATLIVVLFLLLLPLSTPRIYATDEVQYYAYLRSVYFDGDLDFHNEYEYFARQGEQNGDPSVYNALLRDRPDDPPVSPVTGKLRNVAPIGSAILWAPGYALADMLVVIARGFGSSIVRDGFSWPYIWAACLMSALYALLGLLLCYRLARRYAGVWAATAATIGIWLATPLVFYSYILMPWSHAPGFFLFALFLTVWFGVRDGSGRRSGVSGQGSEIQPATRNPQPAALHWALLGLIGGLMTLTREQLGLLLIIPALDGLLRYTRLAWQREWRGVARLAAGHLLFLVAFGLALIPQLITYQVLYGQPRPSTVVSGKLRRCSPHLFDTLVAANPAPDFHQRACGELVGAVYQALGRPFDPDDWYFVAEVDRLGLKPWAYGALLWSPILALALLGLGWLWRLDRRLTLLLLAGLGGQVFINGAISTWHLSGSFGFRRLIECTPIFVLGLAALFAALRGPARRWLPVLALVLFVYWNAGLMVQWTVMATPQRTIRQGLVWGDMLRYQFVEVPRAATSKLSTLLFDRCKLVKNC